jgi:hypothetical protein
MKKNVFVLGLEDYNLRILHHLPGAAQFEFHPLLSYAEIRGKGTLDIGALLGLCRSRLASFHGSVDAVIGYFDFPVTMMIPLLRKEYGLPSPSLESVLKCEHKYWSRLEQQQVIPEHIPHFEAFDPFDDDQIAGLSLMFPYWIKPVKSFRSFLAYRINDEEDIRASIPEIRRFIPGLSEPFNYFLEQAQVPEHVAAIGGKSCIAESLLSGSQCTLEGYVYNGRVEVYGVVDSVRETDRSSFSRYEYPSRLPQRVQEKMMQAAETVLTGIGFDNSPFNVEFFFNQTEGQVYLLEINPRISQSHAEMFEKVNGMSHHEVAIDIALGREPSYPLGRGEYAVAGKFMLRHFEDAVVTRVPSAEEIARIAEEIPGTGVDILVKEGTRLSELRNQDSYSYELADIYLGASDHEELVVRYQRVLEMLEFRFAPGQESYGL